MKARWVTWLIVGASWMGAWAEEEYRFTLDGEKLSPQVTPVFGTVGAPAAGDLVEIDRFLLVLEGPGEYAFRQDESHRLMGKLPGMAEEACVALRVEQERDGDTWKLDDPLSTLDAKQKGLLRGIVMDGQPKDPAAAFEGVSWAKCALSVNYGFCGKENHEVLPALPAELRYFAFSLSMTPSVRDARSLAPLEHLVFLRLDRGVELDLKKLKCAARIRHFELNGAEPKAVEAIGSWKALRTLDLAGAEDLSDIRFVRELPELRSLNLTWASNVRDISAVASLAKLQSLDIRMTPVRDLTPVGKLKDLRTIEANQSGLETLPETPEMPALRRLSILSTKVPAAQAERFRAALPECLLLSSWRGSLLSAVKGADRLTVRSGGTCHRDVESEKLLFEIKDGEEIRKFVEGLSIDEAGSGFHCMCCGDPSIEFYQDGRLLATLGFHHGRSLRWSAGDWPGDCLLTAAAADHLCGFMAQHGYRQPLEERVEGKRQEAAMARYVNACLSYASGDQLNEWCDLHGKGETKELIKLVGKAWPEPGERAGRLYCLYGARVNGSWRLSCGADAMLQEALLGTVEAKQLQALLGRKDCPDQAMQGIARRLLFDREGAGLLKGLPDELLAKLADWGWRHPQGENRGQTSIALAGIGQERADKLLLGFLSQPVEPRKLPEEDRHEPGGQVTFMPQPIELPDGAGARAITALLLAHRKHHAARQEIERLAKDAPAEEREFYRQALEMLDKK